MHLSALIVLKTNFATSHVFFYKHLQVMDLYCLQLYSQTKNYDYKRLVFMSVYPSVSNS